MGELDQNVGLVGRQGIVELTENLVVRDPRRRLPIVVAYAPGGGGKTALVTHLERRYNANTPLAMVELTQDKSKTPQDVLDAVFIRLLRDSHPQFGKLRLPRYEAARIIRGCAAETITAPNPHALIRKRLSEELTTLPAFIESIRAGGETEGGLTGFLSRLTQPLFRWFFSAAVVAPRPLRWLAGRKVAAAFRWYESEAHKYLKGLARGVHVDSVGAHIHGKINDEPVNDAARDQINAFMVAALLADLRAEYRFHPARKTNCLMLLDNADLLSPDEAELWAVSGSHGKPPHGKDLLELLAEELRDHPDTPLLVVATKQAAPAADGFGRDDYVQPGGTEGDPRLQARRRLQRWWRNQREGNEQTSAMPRASYLPVRLDPLTLDETRQLLRELSEVDEQTVREEVRVREIYEATHGHPQAIQLISKKLSLSSDKNSAVPPVRSIYDELARPEEGDADRDETVRGYLLMRFLQRFRTEPLPSDPLDLPPDDPEVVDPPVKAVRRETTELLSRLAAPMWLDEASLVLLAGDRDAEGLRRIKDYLGILSFVETGEDGNWYLHPLLRDLLVNELLANEEDLGFSYGQVHRELAQHHAGDPWKAGSLLAMQYHLLALGEVTEVAKLFAERARRAKVGDDWHADLECIVCAPNVRQGNGQEVRSWSGVQNLAKDVVRSQPFEQAIIALQALRSCTSRDRWDERTLTQLDDAFGVVAKRPDVNVAALRDKYRKIRAGGGSVSVPPLPAVLRSDRVFPFPRVVVSRHVVRRSVASLVALTVVAYGGVYAIHLQQHCVGSSTPFVDSVQWLWDDSTTLDKEDDGQCLGISRYPGSFMADPTPGPEDREIQGLTGLIRDENDKVEKARNNNDHPYVTIVVPTSLSSGDERPERSLAVGVNELRGAYLAQKKWNAFGKAIGGPEIYVRLLPANFGGEFSGAASVVPKLQELARRDQTVIGVTGLNQTRDSTIKAVQALGDGGGQRALPMVSSEASGSQLSGLPYFFRVAVPTQREANAGAAFLAKQGESQARKRFVLVDPDDAYSTELSNGYKNALGGEAPIRLEYSSDGKDLRSVLSAHMKSMCADSAGEGRKPLLLYTGRSSDYNDVLQALSQTGQCTADSLVLGSDDLSQSDLSAKSYLHGLRGFHDGQLLFTNFSMTRQAWENVEDQDGSASAARDFFESYEEMSPAPSGPPGSPFWTPVNAHVSAAYDAVSLLLAAVDRAPVDSAQKTPSRSAVYQALRGTTGDQAYQGVSGRIDFGVPESRDQRSPGADPQEKRIAVNRIAGIGGGLRIEHVDDFGRG